MSNAINNKFDQLYKAFNESTLQQRLTAKYAPKAYHVRFKLLRILALVSSYGFNVFSALTASATVYFFVLKITGFQGAAIGATLFFIGILEATKRAVSSRLFQNVLQYKKYGPGMVAVLVGLMCMSITFSYEGAKQSVMAFVPPPALLDTESQTAHHNAQLEAIDEQIQEARNTTYKGTTTRTSQQTIRTLTDQKAMLQKTFVEQEQRSDSDNRTTIEQHQDKTHLDARYFAFFTLALEVLFLMCAWYLEYYDFRSYIELKEPKKATITSVPISLPLPLENDIKKMILLLMQ